jgi:hypothetical protein
MGRGMRLHGDQISLINVGGGIGLLCGKIVKFKGKGMGRGIGLYGDQISLINVGGDI